VNATIGILTTALTPALLQTRTHTERAAAWFLSSGIQEETGGVARYYRSDVAKNARVSTEITGYAISGLLDAYNRIGAAGLLRAAERAGRFLTQMAWSPGLATFPFEHSVSGDAPQPLAYFFDCGIIVRGLVRLARETAKDEYLDIAVRAGRSMAADFPSASGFHPILSLPDKAPLPYTGQWSRSPGCYQLKSALAWHDLAAATGDAQFTALYEAAVIWALSVKDSFLPAETPEKTMDRLHAYCYFLEGMTPLAGRSDCAAALAEGIERVSGYLRSIPPAFERSDVYAQLLRIRLLTRQVVPISHTAAGEEAAAIGGFQLEDPDSRIEGGFAFGRAGGQMLPYVNPVSTVFCVQALDMWDDFEAGRAIDPQTLI
jgi:hypothetical protein